MINEKVRRKSDRFRREKGKKHRGKIGLKMGLGN